MLRYDDFIRKIRQSREDFDALLEMSPADPEFTLLKHKYENFLETYFESSMTFTHDQPYSPENGKVLYFNEAVLSYDPFGYYVHK